MIEPLKYLERTFWSFETKHTRQTIGTFLRTESAPNANILRTDLESLVDLIERLRVKVSLSGEPGWKEDESFSLDNHFSEIIIPDISCLDDLNKQVGHLFSEPLDYSAPPWKLYIVSNGQTGALGFHGVLFKFHHSFADGIGGLEMLLALASKKPDEAAHRPKSFIAQFSINEEAHPAVDGLNLKSTFFSALKLISETFGAKAKGPFNGKNSTDRTLNYVDFPMERIKKIARSAGASSNDVALAIVSGSARKFMDKNPVNLRAIVPFSLRKASARKRIGNYLSAVGVNLPASIKNPKTRLKEISSYLGRIKKYHSFRAYELISRICFRLPLSFQKFLAEKQAERSSFICTNVPWPNKPRYIGGAKIVGNYGLPALLKSQGAAFTFIAYNEKLCISLTSDPNIIEEPKKVVNYLEDSFKELEESYLAA